MMQKIEIETANLERLGLPESYYCCCSHGPFRSPRGDRSSCGNSYHLDLLKYCLGDAVIGGDYFDRNHHHQACLWPGN